MRFLVLGAGLQGSACTFDLLRQADVERVTLADRDEDAGADFLPDDPRLHRVQLDFTDEDRVLEVMREHGTVLSAAPYYLNGTLAGLAVRAGCHFADLGGNTEIVREQLELAGAAREAGCCVVPDVGLAPGMVNVFAAEGIRRLDPARSVRMYVGGLPQNPVPPLNYKLVYSLEGMLDYYTTPCEILRGGEVTRVEALTELEELQFERVGALEAFHTAGGTSLLPWDHVGEVDEIVYKTLRYPGHAAIMRTVRELGLLEESPIEVGDQQVVPRDVFIACVQPLLMTGDDLDLVAMRVVAEGERSGDPVTIEWEIVDYANPDTGVSAMERTTGFTLSIIGLFLGRGVIEERGAGPAYRMAPYGPYVEELRARGIDVRVRED